MRIHSDIITQAQLLDALPATTYIDRLSKHRSQKRGHAFEVNLAGSGKVGGQWGQLDGKAATWDEWGMFLAALYTIDPNMHTPAYPSGADEFHWATGNRFATLTPDEQHKQHRWNWEGTSAGDTYTVHTCKGSKAVECTAMTRRTLWGHTYAELA